MSTTALLAYLRPDLTAISINANPSPFRGNPISRFFAPTSPRPVKVHSEQRILPSFLRLDDSVAKQSKFGAKS
jgi:hypothetical protein